MDIVMTGYAGLAEAAELVQTEYRVLRERLSADFLKQLTEIPQNVCPLPEDPAELPHIQWSRERKIPDGTVIPSVPMAVAVEEGGVFEALWNLGELARMGLTVDMADIPVKQEVVEVCELLDRNLYQMRSGCLLYLADNGRGCPGKVIGQTTKAKGKTITGAEGVRYLDKPRHN